jgi:glycosyltransferase involved in cell wall biosynthesis
MRNSLTISVALCIFNGERFLRRQLQSLSSQMRRPDELVVCDDGSTDSSLEIIETFAGAAPFPVRLTRNPVQLGPAQNFGHAIEHCTGDLIACCDQDDVWMPTKLATLEKVFANDPQLAFAFSDARMCGEDGADLGYRLWDSVLFVGRLRRLFDSGRAFDVLLRQNVVTGTTLCFASKFRSLILPIDRLWMHDGWIALLLAAVGKGLAIDPPLVEYRQHPTQSVGATRRSLYQQYLNAKKMDRIVFSEQADAYEAALARLQEQTDYDVPTTIIQALQEKIQHCRRRSAIRLGEASKLSSLEELVTFRYRRFSLGWKSFAQDLFL